MAKLAFHVTLGPDDVRNDASGGWQWDGLRLPGCEVTKAYVDARPLRPGADYVVDPRTARVRLVNEGGAPANAQHITLEIEHKTPILPVGAASLIASMLALCAVAFVYIGNAKTDRSQECATCMEALQQARAMAPLPATAGDATALAQPSGSAITPPAKSADPRVNSAQKASSANPGQAPTGTSKAPGVGTTGPKPGASSTPTEDPETPPHRNPDPFINSSHVSEKIGSQ